MLSNFLPDLKKQTLSFIAELITDDGKHRELLFFPTINLNGNHCFDRWTVGNFFGIVDLIESGFTTRSALKLARSMAYVTNHFSMIAEYESDVNRAYNRVMRIGNTALFPICGNDFEQELSSETMYKLGVESFSLKSSDAKSWYEPDGFAFKYPRINNPESENAISDLETYIKSYLSEQHCPHTKAEEWSISIVVSGKLTYNDIDEIDYFLSEENQRNSLLNICGITGFCF